MKLIFDIETDGLLDSCSKIHSLVIKNEENGEVFSCTNSGYGYKTIEFGLDLLSKADCIIGHNIISFDIPAIKKIYPNWTYKDRFDTYNAASIVWTDIFSVDIARKHLFTENLKLMGTHKLEAWGVRLQVLKGDFGKTSDWKSWSKEMQDYCEQDVEVTNKLYYLIKCQDYSKDAFDLEFAFQEYLFDQQQNGVPFNITRAKELATELKLEKIEIKHKLHALVPPKEEKTVFIPKQTNKKYGYIKGVPVPRVNKIELNPSSRQQIIDHFKEKYKWVPTEFTKKNAPKMTAEVLDSLPFDEAPIISKYLQVTNLLAKLSDGKESWIKHLRNGRIHGRVIASGAVTFRCTHSRPNLSQVTSDRKYKGKEARELFYAPNGNFVGADASGLELRNLAHYLRPYDKGKYIDAVLNGDIHTKNKEDAGLATRDQAKRFIYAFNYGAGDEMLGSIVDPKATKMQQKSLGKDLRSTFLSKNPAIASLLRDLENATASRNYLIGLKGYKIYIREKYRLLNSLLQGAGAIIMKQATVNFRDHMLSKDWYQKHVFPALHVHDEIQVIVTDESISEQVGESMVNAIIKAGIDLDFTCPLDGQYHIGKNWMETH